MWKCPWCGFKKPDSKHLEDCFEVALEKARSNPHSIPPGQGIICTEEEWREYRSLKRKRKAQV